MSAPASRSPSYARIRSAPADQSDEYQYTLFTALLAQPWTEANENEAFSLLNKFSVGEESAQSLIYRIQQLYQFDDGMIRAELRQRSRPSNIPSG